MFDLTDTCQANIYSRGRLCACLEQTALGRLRAITGDLSAGRDTLLFADGDKADAVFGLRKGVVMLSKQLGDGRRQVLGFLFPGDLFGLPADDHHTASATALTRVSLCCIPLSIAETDSQFAGQLRRVAQNAVAEAYANALMLGRMTARERVATFLIETWRRNCCPEELHLPMKAADIGDYLGLRAETVSRYFSEFRRAGWIGPWHCDGFMPIVAPAAITSSVRQG